MKEQIKKTIRKIVTKLYPEQNDVSFAVDYAPVATGADFASNAAMILAKKVRKSPMAVAEEILRFAQNDKSFTVTVAKPGFLNFTLSSEALLDILSDILASPDKFGASDLGKGQLAIVEYFQLNVAKPAHVGHLRSAVIGDCLKRILRFVGYKAISDTHIGDWGTQLGIMIAALKKNQGDKTAVIRDIQSSVQAYVKQSQLEDERDIGKAEFVKLEKGDPVNRQYWQGLVETARQSLKKSAEKLQLLNFEYELGESFYEDKMPAIIERLEEKGLLQIGETGEKYVDLEEYGLGRLICVKSDGGTTYEMRDLATLAYRYDELPQAVIARNIGTKQSQRLVPSDDGIAALAPLARNDKKLELAWNLYVVDSRQAHDFKQVFKTMGMLGYDVAKSKHVEFGFMSLPEGPISTRKGTIISLEALIDEAKKRALGIINEKNPDLVHKERVAGQVALAAVKYADLVHNRKSDIVFRWDEALSFEGNTGPYLQYTHARLKSILRKSGATPHLSSPTSGEELKEGERTVLRKLSYFPDIIEETASEFLPSTLAAYLYDLAGQVNSFYHSSPVIQEKDEKLRELRLAVVMASANVLKNGLDLLGIEAPEEM
ncbi:MAG: arginine--tRNA ligase [Candidatus Doudnabacteria bacterium]|nr:arginine--tRNA ligase [Candidatus Doudnabacteria bacterium]